MTAALDKKKLNNLNENKLLVEILNLPLTVVPAIVSDAESDSQ